MHKNLLILVAATLLEGCVIYLDDSGKRRDLQYELRTQTLPATDMSQLSITAGPGKLEIIGEEGRENIEYTADVFVRDPASVDLALVAAGDNARLIANVRDGFRQGDWGYIDLVVRVPAQLALDIEDGSGDISIRGMHGSVLVDDASGDLFLSGAGSATIKDGSGNLVVENVEGAVFIEDGSGNIEVRQVGGEVTIQDGSGDISVITAGGLNLLNSGSGSLNLRDIRGVFNFSQ